VWLTQQATTSIFYPNISACAQQRAGNAKSVTTRSSAIADKPRDARYGRTFCPEASVYGLGLGLGLEGSGLGLDLESCIDYCLASPSKFKLKKYNKINNNSYNPQFSNTLCAINNKWIFKQKTVKIQFIRYPVRLSDVLHILISSTVVCSKTLVLRPMALASKVQALALVLRLWPWCWR